MISYAYDTVILIECTDWNTVNNLADNDIIF